MPRPKKKEGFRLSKTNRILIYVLVVLGETIVALFILGLFRSYDSGIRVEGIPVARNLWKHGKKALIISERAEGADIDSPVYWNYSNKKKLTEAIHFLSNHSISNVDDDLDRLTLLFEEYCFIPQSHK